MSFADGLDATLEWTVLGSFTRLGHAIRRRLDHWEPLPRRIDGQVVVITGATSGLGLETARQLAVQGATVEIVARNAEKAERTCVQLREQSGNPRVHWVEGDTGSLAAMRRVAAELSSRHQAVSCLIHNAGALDDVRTESPEGLEFTVASHVVGPFLLTTLLIPMLRAAAGARVVWVTSGGLYSEPLNVAQLELAPREYDGTTAYARAKRAQVTLMQLLAARLERDRIQVHAMHPGWVDTPGLVRSLPTFRRVLGPALRTPAQGADTLVWLATAEERALHPNGQLWLDRRPRALHRLASTRRSDTELERARLWAWALEKSGASL